MEKSAVQAFADMGLVVTCKAQLNNTPNMYAQMMGSACTEPGTYHFHYHVEFSDNQELLQKYVRDVDIIQFPSHLCLTFSSWDDVEKFKRESGLMDAQWDISPE